MLTEATGITWHRVPCSGGLAQDRSQACFQGDVYTSEARYAGVVIECKHYARLTINHLFLNKSILHRAIKQAREESRGSPWIVFIKSNNQGVLMITEAMHTAALQELLDKVPQFTLPMCLGQYNVAKIITNK